jgi:hypothetical protein
VLIHFIPKALLDKFVAEHPVQAVLVIVFGICMLGFTIWLLVSH